MPARPHLATSESLLPSLDYAADESSSPRHGPDLKLVAAPALPEAIPAGSPASVVSEAGSTDLPAAAPEAPPADSRLPALSAFTEEEIIALFS